MSEWRMEGGRFTDGECNLGIENVRDMMVECQDAPQVQANRLGISCQHFVDLAVFACHKLTIKKRRRMHWYEIYILQKERAPQ